VLCCGLIFDLNTTSGVALCFRFEVGGTIKEIQDEAQLNTVASQAF
jgi:hypothetical protein